MEKKANNDVPAQDTSLVNSSRRDFLKKTATAAALTAAIPTAFTKYSRAAPAPINIGCIVSLTGYLSDQAQNVVDGMQLAADTLNSQGGLLGRPINVLVRDDEMNTTVGARRFQELVENDNIVMESGVTFGPIASIISQINKSAGNKAIVQFQSAATQAQQDPKNMDPNLFFIGSAVEAYGTVGGEFMTANVGKRTSILYVDYSSGWQMRDGFLQTAKANGADIQSQIAIPVGTVDFQPFLTQVAGKPLDFVTCVVNGMMLVNCLKQAYAMGLKDKFKFISFQVNIEEVNACGPEVIKDVYLVADYWWNLQTPKNIDFVKSYCAKFGANKRPSVRTFMHYISCMMWADVVRQVKTTDTKAVSAKLVGFKGDLGKGPMEMRKTGDHTCIQTIFVARGNGPKEMKDKFDTQEIVKSYYGDKYYFTPKEKGWA